MIGSHDRMKRRTDPAGLGWLLLALAKAAGDAAGRAAPAPAPAGPDTAPISPGETARALHLDRSGKLARAVEAGLVRTVAVGRARRVPGEELQRLLREGLPDLPDDRQPPAPKAKRRARKARPVAAGSISKIPL